jgi:DNA-binding NtrC family response regulator
MKNILIVDDDNNLCFMLSEELNECGFKSDYVNSADEALEYIKRNDIDLLLLDLKMPEKDGFYVLRKLNELELKLKVIVLTAYADVKSAIDSANLGASEFISKPYEFDDLVVTINKVLKT